MSTTRRRVLVASVAVLLLVGAAAAYAVWPRGSEVERASGLLPADTLRVSWTHWAGLREELGVDEVGGAAGERFYGRVADRDLAASSLASSSAPLEEALGLNPLATEWELLGQARDGMVVVLQLGEGTDMDRLADRFGDAGYTSPGEDRLDGGLWRGGSDVVARLGLSTYEIQHVALLEDQRLLVASDDAGYLERAVPVAAGEEDGLNASALLEHAEDPLTAVALLDDLACETLSMSRADSEAQAEAEALVERAGGVTAVTGYLVSLQADRRLSIVFEFEDESRAERNATAREALAGAEDPAQFVSYPEVFRLDDVSREGTSVVLTGRANPEFTPLSNLTEGPVLLATC